MKLLRSYIKNVINEQQKYFEQASNSNYCFVKIKEGLLTKCILYDKNLLFSLLKSGNFYDMPGVFPSTYEKNKTDDNPVIATVTYMHTDKGSSHYGNCYNGAHVTTAAAKKDSKMGIVAYESALYYATQEFGGLFSDRDGSTGSAENVWKKYSQRNDVKRRKFDNMHEPKTPPKEDDCFSIYPDSKKGEYIDSIYALDKKPSELDALENNHKECVSQLKQFSLSEERFNNTITRYARRLFNSVY